MTNYLRKKTIHIAAACMMALLQVACTKEPPELTVTPNDLLFEAAAGDSKSITITTDASWRIILGNDADSWLRASSTSGTGTTTVTLTTKGFNNSNMKSGPHQIEVVASNDNGESRATVDVSQNAGYVEGCTVEQVKSLTMAYGIASTLKLSPATLYIRWAVYTEDYYNNNLNSDEAILQAAKEEKWAKLTVPVSGEPVIDVYYDQCIPDATYYLVAVSYTKDDDNGNILKEKFNTFAHKDNELARPELNSEVVTTTHDAKETDWYEWAVKKSSQYVGYYTYVCASDKLEPTMTTRKGDLGAFNPQDDINMAYALLNEISNNPQEHETRFNPSRPNTREKILSFCTESDNQWIEAKPTDKYLHVVTWAMNTVEYGKEIDHAGLIYDVVYEVKDGIIITNGSTPPVEYHTSATPSTLTFESSAGTKDITVTSNEQWTATSDATSWCTVSPASGSNGGKVKVAVTANTSTSQRTAHVTVTGKTSGDVTSVIVTQAGKLEDADVRTFTVTGNGKTVTFKMVRVEHGTFQMGATAEQGSDASSDEKPVHSVTLTNDYFMGETEVTQALWYAVMGQKPTASGSQWSGTYGLGDQRPAYYVSWNDCQEFITKLNTLTGQTFRLPTEAEWEFAARGGNKSKGYKYAGSDNIGDVAWYSGNSNSSTHDVATKQANELGLYDMSGNVWEWCSDKYGSYGSSAQTNPTGSTTTVSNRVKRGGSWYFDARLCRVSGRSLFYADHRIYYLGLRLALQ